MGPMRAACRFARELESRKLPGTVKRVRVELYGSLALTGMGHGTDRAVLLGLSGNEPATIDPAAIASMSISGCLWVTSARLAAPIKSSERPGCSFSNVAEIDRCRRSQSISTALRPDTALEAASNVAVVDFPSPGNEEVTRMTLGACGEFEISSPMRTARTVSLS